MTRAFCFVFFGLLTFVWISEASAQRFRWDHEFGQTGPDGTVRALAEHDGDLFIGGQFDEVGPCSSPPCFSNVASWDGSSWSNPDGGLDGTVLALVSFDGTLFAGGWFTEGCAIWDGADWSDASSGLPTLAVVRSFSVVDGVLWAGVQDQSTLDSRIYRWSSVTSTWTGYGPIVHGEINALPWDGDQDVGVFGFLKVPTPSDLNQTVLFDASSFIAMPDHTHCSELIGFRGLPLSGAFFNNSFYVGGSWGDLPCSVVADTFGRFTGSDWAVPFTSEQIPDVPALLVIDEGGGDHLIVGAGRNDLSTSYDPPLSDEFVNRVGRFDGTDWTSLCTGIAGGDAAVVAMCEYDGGVAFGGDFGSAGGMPVVNVARWFFDPCIADWDGSGAVNFFDFNEFQNDYAAENPRADLDCDGEITFFDYSEFQNLYSSGCP